MNVTARRLAGLALAAAAILAGLALLMLGCAPRQTRPATTSPTPSASAQPAAPGKSFTLLHTNDVSGYVDPCG